MVSKTWSEIVRDLWKIALILPLFRAGDDYERRVRIVDMDRFPVDALKKAVTKTSRNGILTLLSTPVVNMICGQRSLGKDFRDS